MDALSVDKALARILADVTTTPVETIALETANDRVLAAPLSATLTQPPFDASAMDGYAVRRADVDQLPVTLMIIGEAAAGHGFQGRVNAGQAVRIFTGAPVPDGADAIVIQENTTRAGDRVTLVEGTPDPNHIRHRGLDFSEGDLLIRRGTKLTPRTLTLAAAMGHAKLQVHSRPKVAIIATGDELVLPGEGRGPDLIVCSNPFGLVAMANAAGAKAEFIGIARDTDDDLRHAIRKAASADILVTIGGASVGDHDLVAPALASENVTLDFWKIKMRPGKPLMFGKRAGQRVLGLPGNPTSSLICARVFLVPLITQMLGLDGLRTTHGTTAQLSQTLPPNGPRAHYMRAVVEDDTTTPPRVCALPNQDSSMLTPLAQADCLIVRAPHAPEADVNDHVIMLTLDF